MAHKIPFAALMLLAITSCTDIPEEDRLIYVPPIEIGQNSRAVLIEDFTGQRCLNCPKATDITNEFIALYGEENIIPIAIHSGGLGYAGSAKYLGLMNDLGKEYGIYWNVESQPIGIVNRATGLTESNLWANAVNRELQKTSPIYFTVNTTYDDDSKLLTVETTIDALQPIAGKLQVWLIQDNIKAFQIMPDGNRNDDYIHNHVFRASLNGMWGDDITMESETRKTFTHTMTLDGSDLSPYAPAYIPADCAIVVFVYDATGVLQVRKYKL